MPDTTYRGYRLTCEPLRNRDTGRTAWVWTIHHRIERGRVLRAKTLAGAKRIVDAIGRESNAVSF